MLTRTLEIQMNQHFFLARFVRLMARPSGWPRDIAFSLNVCPFLFYLLFKRHRGMTLATRDHEEPSHPARSAHNLLQAHKDRTRAGACLRPGALAPCPSLHSWLSVPAVFDRHSHRLISDTHLFFRLVSL